MGFILKIFFFFEKKKLKSEQKGLIPKGYPWLRWVEKASYSVAWKEHEDVDGKKVSGIGIKDLPTPYVIRSCFEYKISWSSFVKCLLFFF